MQFVDNWEALESGYAFGHRNVTEPTAVVITYRFFSSADLPAASELYYFAESTKELADAEKIRFRASLDQFSSAAGVVFVETESEANINILGVNGSNWGGWSGYPQASLNLVLDDMSVDVMVHEIGHALGLKHPFEGELQLSSALDHKSMTVMSYTGRASVLGPLDVEALQHQYGQPVLKDTWVLSNGPGGILVQADAGDNRLIGTLGMQNELHGLAGDDALYGQAGADHLVGGDGNDMLDGHFGDDQLWGGRGNDTIRPGPGRDIILAGDGDDSVENAAGDNEIYGGTGNDSLAGGYGDDSIGGGTGADRIHGGHGNDELWGGAGNDTVDGSYGSDLIGLGAEHDRVSGGYGNDTVWAGTGSDTVLGENGDDELTGGAGQDVIYGGGDNDTIYAGSGNDTLGGSSGNDEIWTGEGDDLVWAGTGNDTLLGLAGDDTLWGGSGADLLNGGAGNDTLYVGRAPGHSTIGVSDTVVFSAGADQVFRFMKNDMVDLSDVAAITDFADLQANHLSKGMDVTIYDGHGNSLMLAGVWSGTLEAENFIF